MDVKTATEVAVGGRVRAHQTRRAATFLATAVFVAAVFFATFLAAVAALRELLAGTTTFLTEAVFTGALPARAAVEPARVLLAADSLPAADFGAGLATPFCEPAGFVAAASRAVSLRAGPRVDEERSAGVLARGSLAAAVFLAAGFLSAAVLAGVSSSASSGLAALARFLGFGASSSSSSLPSALTSPARPEPPPS